MDQHRLADAGLFTHVESLIGREMPADRIVVFGAEQRGFYDEELGAAGRVNERFVRAGIAGYDDAATSRVGDRAAPGRNVMAPRDEPDRQVADRHPSRGVVLEHLEGVIEERIALADRSGQFGHPLTAAGRQQDRNLPAAVAGPGQEVPQGNEVDEVVGVQVPDDDGIETAGVTDRHEAADHTLAAIDQDPGRASLDEGPGGRRVGLGRRCPGSDDRDASHAEDTALAIPGSSHGGTRIAVSAIRQIEGLGAYCRCTMALMIEARPLAETLAGVPFFSGLDAATLERVGRGMRTRRFRRGEVIFHLGDPGDALFIVMTGAIKIMLPSDAGDEAILATLRPGDVFGELALLDGAPRSATAAALEPTETLILPRGQFRDLLATEPAIVDALLASLASELRRLTNHVEELHFLDITGRLASRLARLASESGKKLSDGTIRLRAPLTQGDLAAMIGCTRQSVNKLLGMFTDDGLIRLERDSIVVLDLEGLHRAARR